jgi:hypothetical protein
MQVPQLNNDPTDLMAAIARALDSVQGPVPWDQRIVVGCWNVSRSPKLTPLVVSLYLPPIYFT